VLPSGGDRQVLIVNGFDRYDRFLNYRQTLPPPDNTVDRVWARYNNSRDYAVQVASAIDAATPGVQVASTSNEAVISGAVNLTDYHTVIWILGEESTVNDTFDATEQTKVEQFIAGGGNLFLTGAEIGWDLDQQNNGRTFYESTLKGNYVADDANTYTVSAAVGGIFAGLANFTFDNGTLFYNAEFPDVIAAQAGAQVALNYSGGVGGGAGIQVQGTAGRGSIVMFGFPFETITSADTRRDIIDRVFDFFGLAADAPDNADFNSDGIVDTADYVVWRRYNGTSVPPGTQGDADHNGQVNSLDHDIWQAQYGTSPGAGAAAAELTTLDESPVATSSVARETEPSTPVSSAARAESFGGRTNDTSELRSGRRTPTGFRARRSMPDGPSELNLLLMPSKDWSVDEKLAGETEIMSQAPRKSGDFTAFNGELIDARSCDAQSSGGLKRLGR
jgi:hypothetical protein